MEGPALIRFRDTATGRPIAPELSNPGHPVNGLRFSPDGRLLAGHGEGRVTFWDTATGLDLITLRDSPWQVVNLEFSQDGHRLRAVGWSGGNYTLKTWDAFPRR